MTLFPPFASWQVSPLRLIKFATLTSACLMAWGCAESFDEAAQDDADATFVQAQSAGVVYYENFEGAFREKSDSSFLVQSGPSNNNNSGFDKKGAVEFSNSIGRTELVSGAAAYGNGAVALTLNKNNSRLEFAQSNEFNESNFSGAAECLTGDRV